MTYKVLARTPHKDRYPFRTFRECDTLAEAMAVAARLEKNTDLEVLVEMPDNALQKVPLRLLKLTA